MRKVKKRGMNLWVTETTSGRSRVRKRMCKRMSKEREGGVR